MALYGIPNYSQYPGTGYAPLAKPNQHSTGSQTTGTYGYDAAGNRTSSNESTANTEPLISSPYAADSYNATGEQIGGSGRSAPGVRQGAYEEQAMEALRNLHNQPMQENAKQQSDYNYGATRGMNGINSLISQKTYEGLLGGQQQIKPILG